MKWSLPRKQVPSIFNEGFQLNWAKSGKNESFCVYPWHNFYHFSGPYLLDILKDFWATLKILDFHANLSTMVSCVIVKTLNCHNPDCFSPFWPIFFTQYWGNQPFSDGTKSKVFAGLTSDLVKIEIKNAYVHNTLLVSQKQLFFHYSCHHVKTVFKP